METNDEKDPMVFTFELPGVDEKSVGMTLSKMDSIRKIIAVEPTSLPTSEEYQG